jgi:hypothetical protein
MSLRASLDVVQASGTLLVPLYPAGPREGETRT